MIDSDGSLGIRIQRSARHNPSFAPYLAISQTDTGALERASQITGLGSVRVKAGAPKPGESDARGIVSRRAFYTWRIEGRQAAEVIRDIYPYLIIKRLQAQVVYALTESLRRDQPGRARPVPAELIAYRMKLHAAVRSLNQREPVDLPPLPEVPPAEEPGWYWRGCYPWAKPNAMPESAKDRCTTAHSYVLHFAKSPRYFFDGDAISEPAAWERWGDQTTPKYEGTDSKTGWMQPKTKAQIRAIDGFGRRQGADARDGRGDPKGERSVPNVEISGQKHPRSVWTIPTQGYAEAHFATWPEALAERIIKAATSERGCCPVCGKPWEREKERGYIDTWKRNKRPGVVTPGADQHANRARDGHVRGWTRSDTTLGWRPGCDHYGRDDERLTTHLDCDGTGRDSRDRAVSGIATDCGDSASRLDLQLDDSQVLPCTVLDPFLGSGTTAYVARRLGLRSIGIELNERYCELAARRMQQQSLFATQP